MIIKNLNIKCGNFYYYFEPFTGFLLKKKFFSKNINILTSEIENAICGCNNPYKLEIYDHSDGIMIATRFIKFYSFLLIKFCRISFYLGFLLTKLIKPVFDSTSEAIAVFRNLYPENMQNNLCLPRTLFAASLSKKFKNNGAIIIGVFLPSSLMHAWIIENNTQPDPYDVNWTNFQPIAIFY